MPSAATSLNSPSVRAGSQQSGELQPNSARAYRWLMTALLLLFVLNIFIFAGRPADGASYAVIVPPHLGEAALMQTVAAADGTLVRESRYPWLAIVSPANAAAEPGFGRALRRAGAVLLLHPAVLAGCFTPEPPSR